MTLIPLNDQSIELLNNFLEKAKGHRFCLFCDNGGWNCICGYCPEGEYHDENCFAMQIQYIVDIYYERGKRKVSTSPIITTTNTIEGDSEEEEEEKIHVMVVEDYEALKARIQELENEVEDNLRVICNLQG